MLDNIVFKQVTDTKFERGSQSHIEIVQSQVLRTVEASPYWIEQTRNHLKSGYPSLLDSWERTVALLNEVEPKINEFKRDFELHVTGRIARAWMDVEDQLPRYKSEPTNWVDFDVITSMITLIWSIEGAIPESEMIGKVWDKSTCTFRDDFLIWGKSDGNVVLARGKTRALSTALEVIDALILENEAFRLRFLELAKKTDSTIEAIRQVQKSFASIRYQIESDETLDGKCPHCPAFWRLF